MARSFVARSSSAEMGEAGWPARVSVVAVGRYKEYPKYEGASEASPMDYLRLRHGSKVAVFDVVRHTWPHTACNQQTAARAGTTRKPDQPIEDRTNQSQTNQI